MPDDLSNRGRPDRDRTNVNEEHELRNWAQSLGVTPEELKEAVPSVARRLLLGAAESLDDPLEAFRDSRHKPVGQWSDTGDRKSQSVDSSSAPR